MKILLTTDTVGGVWNYSIELARALRSPDTLPPPVLRRRAEWGFILPQPPSTAPSSCGTAALGCDRPKADTPPLQNGAAGFPASTCRSQDLHPPIHIALATMGAPLSPEQRRQVEALDHVTLFESHYKLEWMSDPWPDVEAASHWLLDIESQFKPDLIHLNGYAHGSLPWRSPVIIVAHSCVLSWWQAVKREPAPPQWHRYRAAVRDGLRSADVVVAPSAAMLQSIQELYGPLPATQVIPNARDASLFRPAKKDPFILSAGRLWDEAKNVAALARIAPDLHWPVSVAGEGGESLPSNIRWLGRLDQSQMAGILSRAALYALPARYEPFGLSVLEAALSGCALVLGDIPSLRENWSGAARFVDPGDHRQLLHALNDLIRDHHARAALSAAALSRASRFSTDRLASVYLTAYQHLARSPQPADLPPVERISVCGS